MTASALQIPRLYSITSTPLTIIIYHGDRNMSKLLKAENGCYACTDLKRYCLTTAPSNEENLEDWVGYTAETIKEIVFEMKMARMYSKGVLLLTNYIPLGYLIVLGDILTQLDKNLEESFHHLQISFGYTASLFNSIICQHIVPKLLSIL